MNLSPLRSTALLALVAGSAALAGCATTSPRGNAYGNGYDSNHSSSRGCQDCGTVVDIARFQDDRHASGGGAVVGAVVGGLIGNQVGSGSGRKAATVAGAVAGGVAGHRIEQRAGTSGYEVHVRLDSGRVAVVEQRDIGALRVGSYVRIRDGSAQLH